MSNLMKHWTPRGGRILEDTTRDWEIDKIDVAGCFDVKQFLGFLRSRKHHTEWMDLLIDSMDPNRPDTVDWCGRLPEQGGERRTKWSTPTMERIIKESAKGDHPIWTSAEGVKEKVTRISSAFLVEKSRDPLGKVLARIVMSCKKMNEDFKRPPKVHLPEIDLLFELIAFFPEAFFQSLDFRHFFYQLPLPANVRHLFTVETVQGDETRHHMLTVWPMGFTWTPWVAQNISMSVLYRVRDAWRRKKGMEEVPWPKDEVEPYVTVRGPGGVIVAFLLAWYDNILIITGSSGVRKELSDLLKVVLVDWGVRVKKGEAGWVPSTDEVEYMGLHFKKQEGAWYWSHAAKNREQWRSKFAAPLGAVEPAESVAARIGVIMWDLLVSGQPKSVAREVLGLSARLGRKMVGHDDWGLHVEVSNEEAQLLQVNLARIWAGEWFSRPVSWTPDIKQIAYVAADASDASGAAILLQEDGSFTEIWYQDWSEAEKANPINWRETKTAIEAVEVLAERWHRQGVSAFILLAEDNTSAKAALNAWYYPQDPSLCGRLLQLYAKESLLGMKAIYIDTTMQPADELTRRGRPSAVKVRQAIAHLRKSYLEAFSRIDTLRMEKEKMLTLRAASGGGKSSRKRSR
jgi:hypothetical protein